MLLNKKLLINFRFRNDLRFFWGLILIVGFSCTSESKKMGSTNPNSASAIKEIKECLKKSHPDSCFQALQDLLKLTKDNDDYNEAIVLKQLGIYHLKKANYIEAKRSNNKALKIFEKLGKIEEYIDVYNNQGVLYQYEGEYDKAHTYHTKAIKLSRELNYDKGIIGGYQNIAVLYSYRQEYDSSLVQLQVLLDSFINKETPIKKLLSVKNQRAINLIGKGDFESGENEYQEVFILAKQHDMKSDLARGYQNYGNHLYRKSEYDSCLVYWDKSLKIFEKLGDAKSIISLNHNFCLIYKEKKMFNHAIKCYEEALIASKEPHAKISTIINLSYLYEDKKEIDKALELIDKALKMSLANDITPFLGRIHSRQATLYLLKEEFILSKRSAEKSLDYFKQHNIERPGIYNILGKSYFEQGKLDSSYFFLSKARLILKNSEDIKGLRNNAFYLAELYELQENYQKSLKFYKIYKNRDGELLKSLTNGRVDELLVEKEVVEKDNIILQKEAMAHNQKTTIARISAFLGLMILSILFLFWRFLIKRKNILALQNKNKIIEDQAERLSGNNINLKLQNQKIKDQKEKIDELFRELHHRVKNNLQSLASILNLQSKSLNDGAAKEAILASKGRVLAMGTIHKRLLHQNSDMAHVDIKEYLENLIDDLVDIFEEMLDSVDYEVDVDSVNVKLDTAVSMALIINELVTNSFKYAFEEENITPKLSVKLKEENNKLHLTIKDNGRGIPMDFDINKSDSFGMQIVQMFTQQIKGNLNFMNDNGARYDLYIENYQIS